MTLSWQVSCDAVAVGENGQQALRLLFLVELDCNGAEFGHRLDPGQFVVIPVVCWWNSTPR